MTGKIAPVLALVAATAFGSAALAGNGYMTGHHDLPDRAGATRVDGNMMGHFDDLDQNDDGTVSRAEIVAHDERTQRFEETAQERMEPSR